MKINTYASKWNASAHNNISYKHAHESNKTCLEILKNLLIGIL